MATKRKPGIADWEVAMNPQSEIRNPKSVATLVALATYNEIENLPGLVDEILHVLPHTDVLVVDDNSPDGTGKWCDQRAQAEPRVHCIHRAGKLGLGTAMVAAARFAIDRGYEIFVTLDADWSHDPRHLTELVAALAKADVAIGSRYCPGGKIDGWPVSRRIVSKGVNFLTHLLLRLPARDASGNFRAYRIAKLQEVPLDEVRATGYAFPEELLWNLRRIGATFAEVPITFRDRRAGASKVSFREAWGKLAMIQRLALRRR
jgi:dolichol-phosphate mannosyltransferase